MKKYILLYTLFVYQFFFAQNLPNVVPPSPEASALFKFNETPVSLHSGMHNTTIPLIEINSGGMNIPISLSYHSRGVQVSEIASRVGTGWAMNYGGMISRQIRGLADDLTYGYSGNTNSEANIYSNSTQRNNELNDTNSLLQGNYDYYPDKFMINTNFFSGEFYFDKNNNTIITQKFSDIKIIPQYNDSMIVGFQVTDNLGNNYYFGGLNVSGSEFINENERTLTSYSFSQNGSNSSNGQNNGYFPYSSWFLNKIITNTNDVIEFIYENETTTYYRRTSDTDQYTEQLSNNVNNIGLNNGLGNQDNTLSITHPVTMHFSKIQSYQKILKEVRFNNGKIVFSKSENTRQDIEGGYNLEKIYLYNSNNQIVKQISLNYDYTYSSDNSNFPSVGILINDQYARKRLFLKSIQFKDSLGINIEKSYHFEYDNQILPSRHSNSVDFWGYYNGKNRGQFINWSNTGFNDAVVDPIKVQAGLLKKIIYPTGGYTTFEYEPNILENNLPLNNAEIMDGTTTNPHSLYIPNTNPVELKSEILTPLDTLSYNYSTHSYEKIFTTGYTEGNLSAQVSFSGDFNYYFKLRNNTTGQIYVFFNGSNTINSIPTGSYTLIVKPATADWDPNPSNHPLGFFMDNFFSILLNWYDSEYNSENIVYGPGNRIKKITNYTSVGEPEFSKLYSYNDEFDNVPNGQLFSTSNYLVIKYMLGQFRVLDNFTYNRSIPFSSYSKDNLGYYKVSEFFLDKDNNAKDKITYNYSLFRDLSPYYKFPVHPVSDIDWVRGLELLKTIYKKENGLFKKISEIKNEYLLQNSIIISTPMAEPIENMMPFGLVTEKPLQDNFASHPYIKNKTLFCYPNSTLMNMNHYAFGSDLVYGYRTSYFIGGTMDLHATKVTDYFDNGKTMETLTSYEYDYNNHYNVAKISTTNSVGDVVGTKYSYAPNIGNSVMIAKNMVGIPLKTETYRNGAVLSTQETTYKDWNISTTVDLLSPEFIKTSKGTNPLETRIKYNKIDITNGNPLEVQQESGIKICYIWAYNKTQPVAKLENIAYDAIPTNLITDIQNATTTTATNSGSPEAVVLNYLDALRNSPALANAMITTYTYKPLIGVSTITDPKGDKITYHYDGFNRLEKVTDKDGNILSENKYHYRTQN